MSIKNIKICHLTYKTVCSITFFPLSLEMQIIQFLLNYKQTWRYAYSSFFLFFFFGLNKKQWSITTKERRTTENKNKEKGYSSPTSTSLFFCNSNMDYRPTVVRLCQWRTCPLHVSSNFPALLPRRSLETSLPGPNSISYIHKSIIPNS